MGVYIKGMEMPARCGECKAFVCYKQWAGDRGDCFCGITKSDCKAGAQNADCPLVPVPPHGDLIDRREAIIDANERAYDFWNCDADVDSTVSFLNEQSTIIEAEEGER